MKAYKNPNFQDRVGQAAEAKKAALERLRTKAPVDEKVVEERRAARAAKEAAEAERRAAKKAAEDAAKAAKAEAKAAAEAEAAAAAAAKMIKVPTAQELKAARDARYAARKMRKS